MTLAIRAAKKSDVRRIRHRINKDLMQKLAAYEDIITTNERNEEQKPS